MESNNITIKSISVKETYLVRHPILRAGKPIENCEFEGDEDESTLHLGLFFKTDLIGVASFIKNSNVLFIEKKQYQLRGMAILKEYQKKGFGNLLLVEGEEQLLNKCQRIWFNARENALNFYIKNNYKIIDKPFEIADIGLHNVMSKKII
jgi:ribosomal protein S18 acetylase RimI-like enzyme